MTTDANNMAAEVRDGTQEPSATTAARVTEIVAAMSPHEPVTAPQKRDRLREDLGFESVRLIELTMVLERAFALPALAPAELVGIRSVGDVIELISRHVGGHEQQAPR